MKTIIALLFCVSLLHSHAADISVSDIANKMPTGQLGKPLGSRIVLTGKIPEHPPLLTNPLEVSETDGKALAARVTIEIRGELQIKAGVTYQLEGYEAGEFSGPPDWLNPDSPRPQSPFQYRSFFVVTKVIAPAPKPTGTLKLSAPLQESPPKKPIAPEDSPLKSAQLPADNSPQAIAAAAKMGAETAAADIKAGNFRILGYGEPRDITKDPQTGFRIQAVAGCKVTKTLCAEADAYNQAMRDWHAKNPSKQ